MFPTIAKMVRERANGLKDGKGLFWFFVNLLNINVNVSAGIIVVRTRGKT